jgi:hypothetical protein
LKCEGLKVLLQVLDSLEYVHQFLEGIKVWHLGLRVLFSFLFLLALFPGFTLNFLLQLKELLSHLIVLLTNLATRLFILIHSITHLPENLLDLSISE